MQQLNYHHLLYFWTVAQEGSLAGGAQKLNLTPQTVSTQLRTLEDALGEQLFDRSRRRLTMTEIGRLVYDYADDIFALGRELTDVVKRQPTGRPLRLIIGVADVLPKLVAHRLIDPALHLAEEVQIQCLEDETERLLAKLSVHKLDVVLSDAPIPSTVNIRAFNHMLGECGVAILAAPALVPRYRQGCPQSLHDAPFLLPAGPGSSPSRQSSPAKSTVNTRFARLAKRRASSSAFMPFLSSERFNIQRWRPFVTPLVGRYLRERPSTMK